MITYTEAKAKGLKRYFTGKPCKHGHIAERYVSSKCCIACSQEPDKREYQRANALARYARPEVKQRQSELRRARRVNDPCVALERALRRRMRKVLKGRVKTGHTLELFGCDPQWFLTEYAPHLLRIASKKYGVVMTSQNYGTVWHWDHCEPVSSFDLTDPEQQRDAFGWGNLRPLPAAVNNAKRAKAPDLADVFIGIPREVPPPSLKVAA